MSIFSLCEYIIVSLLKHQEKQVILFAISWYTFYAFLSDPGAYEEEQLGDPFLWDLLMLSYVSEFLYLLNSGIPPLEFFL